MKLAQADHRWRTLMLAALNLLISQD